MLRIPSSLMTQIKLKGIHPADLDKGGYKIDLEFHQGPSSIKYDMRLIVYGQSLKYGQPVHIDAARAERLPNIPLSRFITGSGLSLLVKEIANLNLWGKTATAHILLRTWSSGGAASAVLSNPCAINCPVLPVLGADFQLGSAKSARHLGKILTKEKVDYDLSKGSLLRPFKVSGRTMLFFHGNKLVTSASTGLSRSMNCITFADTALGLFSKNVASKTGADIAKSAGAKPILEEASGNRLRNFFDQKHISEWGKKGYVFWWDGHVTIIDCGLVCEYSESHKGYNETHIHEYEKRFHNKKIYLSELK
jgi:hypothetical protein